MKLIAALLTFCCLLAEALPQQALLLPPILHRGSPSGYEESSNLPLCGPDLRVAATASAMPAPGSLAAESGQTEADSAGLTAESSQPGRASSDNEPESGRTEAETTAKSSTSEESASSGQGALQLETPSAILIEASTGAVIYEKDPHKKMRPASITKIMTLLLIFEAIEKGRIKLEDTVTVSDHAASMGGSQVFLEQGEQQSVQDLIKCISIASANDACVAMAEYIGGSEEGFVAMMNERAGELGMADTTFVNSCGLEAEGHLTSANDISLMARELSLYHPEIFDYCTIWMDSITHRTAKGEKEFGLTNTNKLIRYYTYATGLKTGYTSQSKYCLAATATKDDVDLIAVVMAEKTPTLRTKEAISLLDYGFANCRVYADTDRSLLPTVPVKKGRKEQVPLDYEKDFSHVILDGSATDSIEKSIQLPEELAAPIRAGDKVGSVVYTKDGSEIGRVAIIATEDVEARSYLDCLRKNLEYLLVLPPANSNR